MVMDFIRKRFSFLSNIFGKRGIRFPYILKNKRMEVIYHLFPLFSHFFLYFLEDLKISLYQDQRILFNFKRLLMSSELPTYWHIDCNLHN